MNDVKLEKRLVSYKDKNTGEEKKFWSLRVVVGGQCRIEVNCKEYADKKVLLAFAEDVTDAVKE